MAKPEYSHNDIHWHKTTRVFDVEMNFLVGYAMQV